MDNGALLEQARQMIRAEGEVIVEIAEQLGNSFIKTVQLISGCTGHILVTGAEAGEMLHPATIALVTSCTHCQTVVAAFSSWFAVAVSPSGTAASPSLPNRCARPPRSAAASGWRLARIATIICPDSPGGTT